MTLTKLLRRRYAPLIALVLVAGSWMVLQRLTMELSFPLGYDEAVYVSQTSIVRTFTGRRRGPMDSPC